MMHRALQISALVAGSALFCGSSVKAESNQDGVDAHNHSIKINAPDIILDKGDKSGKNDKGSADNNSNPVNNSIRHADAKGAGKDAKDDKDNNGNKSGNDNNGNKNGKDDNKSHRGPEHCPLPAPPHIFQFMMKHLDALSISDTQKKQLQEMYDAMEKVMEDSDVKDLQKQIHELQMQINELHSQLREKIAKKGGPTDENMRAGLSKILSAEQLDKLIKMLHEESREHSFKARHCSEKFHEALKQILTPEQFIKLREILRAEDESEKKDHDNKGDKDSKKDSDKEKKDKEKKNK